MKVSELIAELECYDEDAEVHFSYVAGDYWKTQLAPKVSNVFESHVQYTTYHQGDKLVDEPEQEEAPDDEKEFPVRRVVVIE